MRWKLTLRPAGFNDQEIVALSGAHALGRCHEDYSGARGCFARHRWCLRRCRHATLRRNTTALCARLRRAVAGDPHDFQVRNTGDAAVS